MRPSTVNTRFSTPISQPIRNPDYENVGAILDKIRIQCHKQRILLAPFFQVFDASGTKKITRSQFVRALTSSGVVFDAEAIAPLMDRFAVDPSRNRDLVNYNQFVAEVEQAFAFRGLEARPRGGRGLPRPLRAADPAAFPLGRARPGLAGGAGRPGAGDPRALLEDALAVLRAVGGRYGLGLREALQDADPARAGRAPREAFEARVLTKVPELGARRAALAALADAYTVPGSGGAVAYRALEDDLAAALRAGEWDFARPGEWGGFGGGGGGGGGGGPGAAAAAPGDPAAADDAPWAWAGAGDPGALERLLRLQVLRRRVPLEDAFAPFDRMSKGRCTRLQFEKVMGTLFAAPFTQDQLDALGDKYQDHRGDVDYRKFIYTLRHPEKYSKSSLHNSSPVLLQKSVQFNSTPSLTEPNQRRETTMGNNDEEVVDNLLDHIRFLIRKDNINMKPTFKDFDRCGEGRVTRAQFLRALSSLRVLDFPPGAPEARALVERYAALDLAHPTASHVNYLHFLQDASPDLVRVAGAAARRKDQALTDDQLGGGSPRARAARAGRRVGPRRHDSPWQRRARAAAGEGWRFSGEAFLRPRTAPAAGVVRPPAERAEHVRALLEGIREYCNAHARRPKDFFEDFDRLGHGRIEAGHLQKGLLNMGVALDPSDLRDLLAHYKDVEWTDAAGRPAFRLEQFLRDLGGHGPQTPADRLRAGRGRGGGAAAAAAERPCPVLQPSASAGTLQRIPAEGLSAREEGELARALGVLAAAVAVGRVDLQPCFADFDPLRRGYIPKKSFGRALTLARLHFDSPQDFDLICKKFEEPGQRTFEEVNYRAFVKALEDIAAGQTPRGVGSASDFRRSVKGTVCSMDFGNYESSMTLVPKRTPFQEAKKASEYKNSLAGTWRLPDHDPEKGITAEAEFEALHRGGVPKGELYETLHEVKHQCALRNVDLGLFFADADIRKRGVMPAGKFLGALSAQLGLELGAARLARLEARYRCAGAAGGGGLVDWRAFVAEVGATPLVDRRDGGAAREHRDDARAERALEKIRAQVRRTNVALGPELADHDLHNTRQIPKEKLFAVLHNHDMMLTPDEEEALFHAFKVSKGLADTNFISYRRFIDALEGPITHPTTSQLS